eukprot:270524-Chlamydomonas_euryale.AAC.1
MHYLNGQCRLCNNMFKFGEGCYSHALASGFCGDCRLKVQGFQSHGRFHAPSPAASRREYICGGCKQVWEHRAQLANKRLRYAPEGCDPGPTHPHV